MTASEIIEKLKPSLKSEGLEVNFVKQEGSTVHVRAKRITAGVPVAFLMKAIEGTYRRYLPEVEDVLLTEYDSGGQSGHEKSELFQPVFEHKPVLQAFALQEQPAVDLRGLDRRVSVRIIERFVDMWKEKSPQVELVGVDEDAPSRAFKKWLAVYEDLFQEVQYPSEDTARIIFDPVRATSEEFTSLKRELMPAKVLMTSEEIESKNDE